MREFAGIRPAEISASSRIGVFNRSIASVGRVVYFHALTSAPLGLALTEPFAAGVMRFSRGITSISKRASAGTIAGVSESSSISLLEGSVVDCGRATARSLAALERRPSTPTSSNLTATRRLTPRSGMVTPYS